LRRAEEKMEGRLTATSSVVDVACGPGTLTIELARRFSEVRALDFSDEMLDVLRHQLREGNVVNVETVSGDGMALPFQDGSSDAAFSLFGLMFFPDRARGFAELFRVLRPGGLAVVSSWAPLDLSSAMSMMFGALRAASPEMPPPMRNLESLENPERFEQELSAAGFSNIAIEAYEYRFEVPKSGKDMFAILSRSGAPLVLMRKRVGEEEWARRSAIAIEFLDVALAKHAGPLTTTAYFGFGTKPR
jgi:ubiquinone/menaquinone biosynthesis C-methylase UbiE